MKLSSNAISLLFLLNPQSVSGFRNNPQGSDPVTKILDDDLSKTVKCPKEAPPIVNQILHTSEECVVDYWARSDIHTLGNVGFGGAVHAVMAPLATKVSFQLLYSQYLTEFYYDLHHIPL
jgi:hypothetical protein